MLPPSKMTAAQKVALVDEALSAAKPEAYLRSMAAALSGYGRDDDARLAWKMAALVGVGHTAAVLKWRSEWLSVS